MKKPTHFMVVDDNRTSNLICEYAIRKFSAEAEVELFTEPEVALDKIKNEYRPDNVDDITVLFLDLNMPSMTGWDFLDAFKDLSKEVQKKFIIYILTSSVDERDKEKARTQPLVSGFYSKPLTLPNIIQACLVS
jgi:two-component system chemotaxis response regulator CheY